MLISAHSVARELLVMAQRKREAADGLVAGNVGLQSVLSYGSGTKKTCFCVMLVLSLIKILLGFFRSLKL